MKNATYIPNAQRLLNKTRSSGERSQTTFSIRPQQIFYRGNRNKAQRPKPSKSSRTGNRTVRPSSWCNIVFVTDGSITESFDIRSGTPLTLDDQIITDFLPEKQLLKHIEIGSALRSPERITYTKRELITIFSEANALLRKEGIREGIERFTEFSNLMFLKLISEIEEDRESNGEER